MEFVALCDAVEGILGYTLHVNGCYGEAALSKRTCCSGAKYGA